MTGLKPNNKINHHFISQSEQRLNCIDPEISKKNQRIFRFNITDHEDYRVELNKNNGDKIEENLSDNDLYTLEIANQGLRLNLEDYFCEYEDKFRPALDSFLRKIKENKRDIVDEIIDMVTLKNLNLFRNPHCIKKTLNILQHHFSNLLPSEPQLKQEFLNIACSKTIKKIKFSKKYKVSPSEYLSWLECLYKLLVVKDHLGMSVLSDATRSIYTNPKNMIFLDVFTFNEAHSDKYATLSDRGFIEIENTAALSSKAFNLTSNIFILESIVDIKEANESDLITRKLHPNTINHLDKRTPEIKVRIHDNDLDALAAYNRHVVYQSAERIFCKGKTIYGINN